MNISLWLLQTVILPGIAHDAHNCENRLIRPTFRSLTRPVHRVSRSEGLVTGSPAHGAAPRFGRRGRKLVANGHRCPTGGYLL
jgi:hypothetical protein